LSISSNPYGPSIGSLLISNIFSLHNVSLRYGCGHGLPKISLAIRTIGFEDDTELFFLTKDTFDEIVMSDENLKYRILSIIEARKKASAPAASIPA
jgi:hypothetical protein